MSALVYPAKTVDPVHRAESRAIGPRDVRGPRVIDVDDFSTQTGRHLTVGVTHLDQLHLRSGRIFLRRSSFYAEYVFSTKECSLAKAILDEYRISQIL